jgi:hypothetical protein
MKQRNLNLLITIFLILFGTFVFAQNVVDSTNFWRIVTIDGNEFYGAIESENDESITFRTEMLGIVKIQRKDIKVQERMVKARVENGQVWLENLQATRYFWAPNGYGLKKGEGYYQNVWVLFNQASVGITKNFSVGAGTIPLFLFNGAPTPIFVVPKFSFSVIPEKLNLGGGVIIGTILSNDEFFDQTGPFGIAYGVATYGNKDKNMNLGLGMAFADGEIANSPVISIGGMARINRRTYFLTENYIYPSDPWFALMAVGGRTVWQRVSLDYGFVIPLASELEGFVAIPWLGFSIPFQY